MQLGSINSYPRRKMYVVVSFTPNSHLVRGRVSLGAYLGAGSSTKYTVPARDRNLMIHSMVSHCSYFFFLNTLFIKPRCHVHMCEDF